MIPIVVARFVARSLAPSASAVNAGVSVVSVVVLGKSIVRYKFEERSSGSPMIVMSSVCLGLYRSRSS